MKKTKRLSFEGGLEDFISFCAENEQASTLEYIRHFLTTLEVNKLEAAYQDEIKPMIYRKEFDEFGLVKQVSLNPDISEYQTLPLPKTQFTLEEYDIVLDNFLKASENVNLWNKFEIMFGVCTIESLMCKSFCEQKSEEYFMHMPPLIVKQVDNDGYPTSYKIGDSYDVVVRDND